MVVGLRPAGAPPSLSRRAIELSASICNKFIPQARKKGVPRIWFRAVDSGASRPSVPKMRELPGSNPGPCLPSSDAGPRVALAMQPFASEARP
jgi:hypothetical protein